MADEPAPEPTTREAVLAILQKEFCDHVPLGELTDDKLLDEELGLDSLDVSEVIMLVEEQMDLQIADTAWSEVKTKSVGNLIRMVERHVKRRDEGVKAL